MASSLLDRALGGVQGQRGGAGNGGGSRRQSGGGGGRGSPYERPADSWKHDKFGKDDELAAPSKPAGGAGKGSLAAPLSGAAAAGGAGGARSNKLVIKNLHYEVSERELELLFVQIGPITAGPKIKFDRSGRSEGIAWVSYGSEDHAAQAKEAFNGAPAKGQPIEVEYDTRPDRAASGPAAGGAAAPGSLLARLGGGGGNDAPRSKYTPPTARPSRGGRNERGVGSQSAPRGGRGAARGGRNGGGGREKKEPKTNEDLDRELEAFMKQPEGAATKPVAGAPPALAAPVAAAAAAAAPAEATSGGDVEMS